MIEALSIEKLKEYGFPNGIIDHFRKEANYEYFFDRGYKNMFFASNKELKVYSGIDAARKFHIFQGKGKMTFPDYDLDLIPEYYRAKRLLFITEKKRLGGIIFDEDFWSKNFSEAEIASVKETIEYRKKRDILSFLAPEDRNRNREVLLKQEQEKITKMEHYLQWLNNLVPPSYLEISQKTASKSITVEQKRLETLEDVAINDTALNQMFKLLIDAELIDKDTKILKDKTGGYKGHFYSSIILFYEKGYFKREPNKNEYLNICKNTFKADIKEATARNHKTRQGSTLAIPPFIPID